MFPFIINQDQLIIPTFFFMMMIGVLAATFYLYWRAPQMGFSQVIMLDCGIVGTVCGFLGGRLFHVFFEAWWFYQEDLGRIFEFWRGGFVSYGAFIGGTLGIVAYLKIRKVNILQYTDFLALGLPLLIMAIRVGCLGAGCCYGKPTDFFLHLIFHDHRSDAGSKFAGVPLHATQVYDFLNGALIFALVHWRYAKKRFDGEIIILFFVLYSFIRGLIEFLRGDADRGVYFDGLISTGHITGLVFIGLCASLYMWLLKKSDPQNSGDDNAGA